MLTDKELQELSGYRSAKDDYYMPRNEHADPGCPGCWQLPQDCRCNSPGFCKVCKHAPCKCETSGTFHIAANVQRAKDNGWCEVCCIDPCQCELGGESKKEDYSTLDRAG